MKIAVYILSITLAAVAIYSYAYITALRHDVQTIANRIQENEIRITGLELEFIDESLPEAKYDMWHGGDTSALNMVLESP